MSIFRFRVFKEYFSQNFRSFAEYPLNFCMALFWTLFSLIVYYFFWLLVFEQGSIPNYNIEKIILYYLFVSGLWYTIGFLKGLQRSIIEGDIVKMLVRKISLEEHFFYSIFSSFYVWLLAPSLIVIFVGIYLLGITAIFGFITFILGLIIGILIYSLVISLSFWAGESREFSFIIDELIVLCSGRILPLDLFPQIFQNILFNYLPFSLMFFIPAKIFLGDLTLTFGLIIKYLLWIVALYLILKFVVRRGLRRYEQLGG